MWDVHFWFPSKAQNFRLLKLSIVVLTTASDSSNVKNLAPDNCHKQNEKDQCNRSHKHIIIHNSTMTNDHCCSLLSIWGRGVELATILSFSSAVGITGEEAFGKLSCFTHLVKAWSCKREKKNLHETRYLAEDFFKENMDFIKGNTHK